MSRSCESCGGAYEAVRANARFCSERCKKRAQRGHVVPLAGKSAPGAAGLVAAVRAELESAKRVDSALGQAALSLAGRVESGADTGSGLASLSRELRATLAEALVGAERAASAVDRARDELLARRRA